MLSGHTIEVFLQRFSHHGAAPLELLLLFLFRSCFFCDLARLFDLSVPMNVFIVLGKLDLEGIVE